MTGATGYTFTEALWTYIGTYFPWANGYKPDQADIQMTSVFNLNSEPLTISIDSEAPCGWLGLCERDDTECNYYKVQPLIVDYPYESNLDQFVFYHQSNCYDEDFLLDITLQQYLSLSFPWLYNQIAIVPDDILSIHEIP